MVHAHLVVNYHQWALQSLNARPLEDIGFEIGGGKVLESEHLRESETLVKLELLKVAVALI